MKIGELSRAAGCTVETIRYYERAGLLPPPVRSEGNYRRYDVTALARLAFIRRCRSLGMSLDEVGELLEAIAAGGDCGSADAVIDAHLDHVTERIRELRALHRQLRELRDICRQPGHVADCGTLKALTGTPAGSQNQAGVKRRLCGI